METALNYHNWCCLARIREVVFWLAAARLRITAFAVAGKLNAGSFNSGLVLLHMNECPFVTAAEPKGRGFRWLSQGKNRVVIEPNPMPEFCKGYG